MSVCRNRQKMHSGNIPKALIKVFNLFVKNLQIKLVDEFIVYINKSRLSANLTKAHRTSGWAEKVQPMELEKFRKTGNF